MQRSFSIDLTGRVAFVTGGGGVLCSTISEALAKAGCSVGIADLRLEAAEEVASRIRKSGGKAIAVECNVLQRSSMKESVSRVENEFGRIDILINGAGGNHPKGTTTKEYLEKVDLEGKEGVIRFFDLVIDGIKFVFDLNFLGTFIPCQVVAESMAKYGRGVIINISSMNAYRPLTKIPAYSAAKAAVSNFTQWLAVHLSKVGIRVNAIAPGFFLTEQNRTLLINEDGSYTERAKKILAHTPMNRFGVPEDLIGTVLWLVSDELSGFVTGVVVPVDGGFLAYSGV